ncbi:MAG: hypothetical protein JKY44_02140 [Flavobacteriaceae bacterium]|nr:hypothetical protein [Flavobacteriaceae bacterium]
MSIHIETDGKFKSLTKGNTDWYYGGGEEAWATILAAKTGVPTNIRAGKTVGIIEADKIVEYIWHPDDITDGGMVLKYSSTGTYVTVASLASYLKVDGRNVIDNGDTTYNIIDYSGKPSIYLTDIALKEPYLSDYATVTVSGNTLSLPSIAFTIKDVGRYMAIFKGHKNPNVSDGSEVPNTQLGRLTTATVKIVSVDVVAQTAVIDQTLNQTGSLDSYTYYNSYDDIQQCIMLAYYFKVSNIYIDISEKLGFNPLFASTYTGNVGFIIKSGTGHDIRINRTSPNAYMKFATEMATIGTIVFDVDPGGSGGLYSDINIHPGDNPSDAHILGLDVLNLGIDNDVISVRDITVKNIVTKREDFHDNIEACFHEGLTGSGGGNHKTAPSEREYQNIYMENIDVKTQNAGYSIFKNAPNGATDEDKGGTVLVSLKDVDINGFTTSNQKSRGRELFFVDNDLHSNSYGREFRFKNGFTNEFAKQVATQIEYTSVSGTVKINTADYPDAINFVNQGIKEMANRGFVVELQAASSGAKYPLDASESISFNEATYTGLPDGTYTYMALTITSTVDNSISGTVAADGLTITLDPNADFSWYDLNIGSSNDPLYMTTSSGVYKIGPAKNASQGTFSITNAKTLVSLTTLPVNEIFTSFTLNYSSGGEGSYNGFGHPVYIHPHCNMVFDNVSTIHDTVWLNTSGGKYNPYGNDIIIKNCKSFNGLQINNSGTYYKSARVQFIDSTITFGSLFRAESLTVENSVTKGGVLDIKSLYSHGNNSFDSDIQVETQKVFYSEHDTFYDIIDFNAGQHIELVRPIFRSAGFSAKSGVTSAAEGLVIINGLGEDSGLMYNLNALSLGDVKYINCYNDSRFGGKTSIMNFEALSDSLIANNSRLDFLGCAISLAGDNNIDGDLNAGTGNMNFMVASGFKAINQCNIFVEPSSAMATIPVISGEASLRMIQYGWMKIVIDPTLTSVIRIEEKSASSNGTWSGIVKSTLSNVLFGNAAHVSNPRSRWGGKSPFLMYTGKIKIVVEDNGGTWGKLFDASETRADSSKVLVNLTSTNINLKRLRRNPKEIITFNIDGINGRIVEESSSLDKFYGVSIPIGEGMDGEKVYSAIKEGVYWVHQKETEFKDETVTLAGITDFTWSSFGRHSTTAIANAYVDTGLRFSIGQEFYNKDFPAMDLTMVLSGGEDVVFKNTGFTVDDDSYTVAPDQLPSVVKNYWTFKGFVPSVSKYLHIAVENLTGRMRFSQATQPGAGVFPDFQTTNNVKYRCNVITSSTWYRGWSGLGIENVTTIERNAILIECLNGYEVIDTDLNQKFTKINGAWI